MTNKLYLESSIIGYLTSRPSRDLITAANQQLTIDWWDNHRTNYDLYISELVITECSAGDPQAAKQRLNIINNLEVLDVTQQAENLAMELVQHVPLPANAEVDALHIAVATVNGMDYLLTWNCTHIANAIFIHKIEAVCRSAGFEPATICTPQQLMED